MTSSAIVAPSLAPRTEALTIRATLGVEPPWCTVTVAGVELACSDKGTGGPAVVCLHAVGHGASDFAGLRRRLTPGRRVITIDWPGQGRSGADPAAPNATRYAALLAGVLDALVVDRVVLVGNSIGGAAAIRYAAMHPTRVAGLVLSNPGGLDRPDRVSRTAINAMVRFFRSGAAGARWFPAAFALYYRLVLQRGAAAEQRARIVATGRDVAPVLAAAWAEFASPEQDLRSVIAGIGCPILFAWAARDQFVQLRRSLPTIRAQPNAELLRFPAGHSPQLETPAAFEAAVERFLGERVQDAG